MALILWSTLWELESLIFGKSGGMEKWQAMNHLDEPKKKKKKKKKKKEREKKEKRTQDCFGLEK